MLKQYIATFTLAVSHKIRLLATLNTISLAFLKASSLALKIDIKSRCVVRQNKHKSPLKTSKRRLKISLGLTAKILL